MADFENPARRYKWFRPRQAAQATGYKDATNLTAVGLFNNSVGDRVLVLRGLRLATFTSSQQFSSYNLHGHLATFFTSQIPVMSSTPQQPGAVYVDDLASQPANLGYSWSVLVNSDVWWEHDYPLAVIEPGWSFVLQTNTATQDLQASFFWESIEIDELDYLY